MSKHDMLEMCCYEEMMVVGLQNELHESNVPSSQKSCLFSAGH